MISYSAITIREFITESGKISSFISGASEGDADTVKSFGEEWKRFDNYELNEIESAGREYFDLMDDSMLNGSATVLDVGCGNGRWAKFIANKVKFVECVEPSQAVYVAKKNLSSYSNVRVSHAGVDSLPFADESFDIVMALGVLHHIPDTAAAIKKCVFKIKKEGWFYVYLYYDLDNRGFLYKSLFRISSTMRKLISIMPGRLKFFICELIALLVYFPLAKLSLAAKYFFPSAKWHSHMLLSYYANKGFRIMRNDALDRFGTPLEQRFAKEGIKKMMEEAGLYQIVFSNNPPYWHAIGKRK